MSIRLMKKGMSGSNYTEQFTDRNLLTFLHDMTALLLNRQNVHSLYYLLLHVFSSLCHILYFDAAKFSIKLFSLIYFTVYVVRHVTKISAGKINLR